jgi:hypothetical protein
MSEVYFIRTGFLTGVRRQTILLSWARWTELVSIPGLRLEQDESTSNRHALFSQDQSPTFSWSSCVAIALNVYVSTARCLLHVRPIIRTTLGEDHKLWRRGNWVGERMVQKVWISSVQSSPWGEVSDGASLWPDIGTGSQIIWQPFPSTSFPIHFSPENLQYGGMYYGLCKK